MPDTPMTLRRLSQFFALALAAIAVWFMVSLPGVVDPEFAGTNYVVIVLMVAVFFGLSFVALRFATAGSTVYWSAETGAKQVGRIGLMIVVMLGLQLLAGRVLDRFGALDSFAGEAVYLLVFTLVPAGFLQFGLVKWPTRLCSASKLRLLVAGVVGIGAAAAWSYAAVDVAPVEMMNSTIGDLSVRIGGLIIGASAEEVIFRVLLLTALLDLGGSRFQAVFLSSVAFGLMHVPPALVQSVGSWPMLLEAAAAYALPFLSLVAAGVFFGVLWLRSGSITLIVLAHAISNVGSTLIYGL